MKVYVLITYGWEDWQIVGVYESIELAKKHVPEGYEWNCYPQYDEELLRARWQEGIKYTDPRYSRPPDKWNDMCEIIEHEVNHALDILIVPMKNANGFEHIIDDGRHSSLDRCLSRYPALRCSCGKYLLQWEHDENSK